MKVRIGYLECAPLVVEIEPASCIVNIEVGWGDRVARNASPAIWGRLADGRKYEAGERNAVFVHGVRINEYLPAAADEAVVAACVAARASVAAAWRADIATRADAATAVEDYSKVLDALDREHEAHARAWAVSVQAIAHKFRRKSVAVGEQTVPGKCVVRSSRGKVLGYANVWDGCWLGTVERL